MIKNKSKKLKKIFWKNNKKKGINTKNKISNSFIFWFKWHNCPHDKKIDQIWNVLETIGIKPDVRNNRGFSIKNDKY